ncbi:MAG: HYR domain-containing protein [Saprospiraceae bacterium]|nr:HYR domain-containing protein [Saprospiraceae bacterium]
MIKVQQPKFIRQLVFGAMALLLSTTVQAQFAITYPAAAQNATVCLNSSTLTVRVGVVTTGSSPTVTIDLPPGINYVPGSVTKTAGTIASITESNVSNVNVPVFALSSSTAGEFIEFTIQREAPNCDAYNYVQSGGTLKDVVSATNSIGTVSESAPGVNTYALIAPAFALTAPAAIANAQIDQNFSRTFTITNGGLGCSQRVRFSLEHTPVCSTTGAKAPVYNTVLTVPGGTVTTVGTVGNITYYEITGSALGGDALFCSGESVTITETGTVGQCNPVTNYRAGWGCGGAATGSSFWCQAASGSGTITMATGVAIPAATAAYPVNAATNQVSWCRDGVYNVTIRNNGSGGNQGAMYNVLANLGYGSNIEGNSAGSKARIISVTINGSTVTYTTPATGSWVANMAQFTTDPDGAGGLADIDGDGQYDDLAPGQQFVMQVTERWQCTTSCPISYAFSPSVGVTYHSACNNACNASGAATTSGQLYSGTQPYYIFHTTNAPSVTVPAQVTCGTTFTVEGLYTADFQPPVLRPTNQMAFVFTLPAGVSLAGTGNPTIDGVPTANITQVGNVVTITATAPSHTFSLDLTSVCDPVSCGATTLNWEFIYTGDNSCNCSEKVGCGAAAFSLACPVPCPDGVNNDPPSIRRLTLGYTDGTLSTMVDPNALPGNSLITVLPKDAFSLTVSGAQNSISGDKDNLHYRYQIGKTSSGQNVLSYVSATFTMTLPGGGSVSCTVPAPADASTATLQAWDWDLSACNGGIFPVGATYDMVLYFEVTTAENSSLYGQTRQQAPNTLSYFYNLDGSTRLYCNPSETSLLVSGIGYIHSATQPSFNGCGRSVLTLTLVGRTNNGFDIFPNEYRPPFAPAATTITLPVGYRLDPTGTTSYSPARWSTALTYNFIGSFVVPGVTQTGNVITIPAYDSSWGPLSDIGRPGGSTMRIDIPIIPTCQSPVGSSNALTTYNEQRYYYAQPNQQSVTNNFSSVFTNSATSRPSISLTNLTGIVQGITPEHYWDVRISNPSTQTAPYIWLALPDLPLGTDIDVVQVEYPIGTPIATTAYSGGKWVKISTAGLATGASFDVRVRFNYYNCSTTSLTAFAGWNCDAYPTDPSTYACPTSTTTLQVIPQPSEVQMTILQQPSAPVSACNPINYELLINSAQAANLVGPVFNLTLPVGMNMSATGLEVEYPNGSGNWATIAATGTAPNLTYDLSTHPNYPAQGLPGTGTNAATAPREMRIRFAVETTCDFTVGDQLRFVINADRPCSSPATGDGITILSSGVSVIGVSQPYTLGLTAGPINPVLNCGNPQTVSYTATVVGGSGTQAGDFILLELDPGASFVLGSFTVTSSPSTNLTFSSLTNSNRTLRLDLAAGLTNATSINYTVQIQGDGFGSCGGSILLRTRSFATVPGPVCVGGDPANGIVAGGTCPATNIVTGQGLPPITFSLDKPTFTISAFSAKGNIAAIPGSNTYTATLTVNNTSATANAVAGTIIEFFCVDASGNITGSPIGTALTPAINAGASTTVNATFTGACAAPFGIAAMIQEVTDPAAPSPGTGNTEQCLCTATAKVSASMANCYAMANPVPSSQNLCFGAIPSALTLTTQNAEPNGVTFVRFAAATINPYSGGTSLGTVTGNGTTATLPAVSLPTSVGTYYIYAIQSPTPSDPACRPYVEYVLNIFPIPTVNAINNVVVCEGDPVSVTISGTPATNTTYTWTSTNATTGIAASGTGNISFTSANVSAAETSVVTVTPTYTNPGSGVICTGTPIMFNITVNALPALSFPQPAPVCEAKATAPLGGSIDETGDPTIASAFWSANVSGGTFTPSTSDLNATYTPPVGFNGSIVLMLTSVDPAGPCGQATATRTLTVLNTPDATPAMLNVCGSGTPLTGIFTLSDANSLVTAQAGVAITYHLTNAEALSGANAQSNTFTATNGTVLYARIVDNTTGCVATTTLTLNVDMGPATAMATLKACAAAPGMAMGSFTLTDANATVDPAGGNTVTYHSSYSDAVADQNPLTSPYSSTTANIWVRVEDADGCYSIDIVQLVVNPLPIAITTVSNVLCNGGTSGTATAIPTSGQANFTYLWSASGAPTSASITGLAAATYTVTVTDGNGCSNTATAVVAQPAVLAATAPVSTNAACAGSATGTATAGQTGGTAPYSYSWSNGSMNKTATGLAAGTYTVTITDANGCQTNTTVAITGPTTPLSVSTAVGTAPTCGLNNGTATATPAGGSTPYTYAWSNGQNMATATGLSAGTYLVTVTDNNGCTAFTAVTLTATGAPTASITAKTNVSCFGGSNGSATVSAAGGTGTYMYAWSTVPAQSTATASNLAAGVYQVTVTSGGCTVVAAVEITQPTLVVAEVIAQANPLCATGSTGVATVNATGGTPGYTYAWPAAAGSQTTATATGLAPGTYTVTVTDINNCTATASVTLTAPTAVTATMTTPTNVLCNGSATGMVSVIPSGGTAPYTALWSNGKTDFNNMNLAAGTYTVTVTDAKGCTGTNSVTITQPATALSASVTASTNPNCLGGANGSATVAGVGGTGAYSYFWSTTPTQTTATATGLSAGNYLVTVQDANGCFTVISVNLTDPTGVNAAITAKTDVACFNGTNGSATVTAYGGGTPYTYVWSANAASQTTATATGLAAGVYTVTVTSAGNTACTAIATVQILQPTRLVLSVSNVSAPACAGSSTGIATVLATGGTTAYAYTWPASAGAQTTATATGLAAGSYVVTVTDAIGCQATVAVDVPVGTDISVNAIANTETLCPNTQVGATLLGSSPVNSSIIYTWSGGSGAGLADGSSTGLNAAIPGFTSGLTEGTYTVTVTASISTCNASTTFTITIDDSTVPFLVNCPSNITLNADVDKCEAVYSWTPPTAMDNCGSVTVTQAAGLAPGSAFTVTGSPTTIIYTANDGRGNTATCSFTVTVVDMQAPTAVCKDITVDLSAAGAVTVTAAQIGGNSTDNCTAVPTLAPASTNFTCANVGDNNITLTVTDAAGNTSTCVATVTVRDVTAPTFTCPGAIMLPSCNNTVPDVVTGITDEADACGVASTSQNPVAGTSFGNVQGGQTSITVTVTDNHGNSTTCNVSVTIDDNTAPTITCPASVTVGTDVDKCTAVVTYSIPTVSDDCPNPVLAQTSGLVSGAIFPMGATVQTYQVTDAGGNTATCSFTVTVVDMQAPTAVCKDITVDLSAAGAVTVMAAQIGGNSTDNCTAVPALAPLNTNYTCANVGDNNITLTVTDAAGNTSTCVATVTVRDVTAPTFTCPADVTVSACTDLVPDVISSISNASDNCQVASIVQNPVVGLDFGNMSGNTLDITVTVTDVNSNVTNCVVVVTIDDNTKPVFVNCPTSMIMIGNDPDQCSGKVNWQPPVALDDCLPMPYSAAGNPLLGTIVQTVGPLPGSIVPITCPPTPITITYQATDGNGNISTCSFGVMVVDTEKPEFDADIVMPNDTVVNCDDMPTNCVFHGPSYVCTPLTNNDVNDNCTAPANLNVNFAEVSTQNPDPAVCGHYDYDITRTWTVTDCSNNALVHVQKIEVQDTTKPVALCKNITVTLDKFGKVNITGLDINNGSYDNCAAAPYLTYVANPSLFNCSNLGPNTVTLTVTDPCGNFGTCTSTVTVVEGIAPCTPQYNVVTSCLDNATTLDNGQFQDMITIKSLAMQNWFVAVNNGGFFTNTSPNPPANPVTVAVGTPFLAGTADNIDNDNDGATDEADEMIYYTLKGRFTECVGYTITVSNAGAGNFGMAPAATTTTISNKACYPNPYFVNLYDPFCLNTPPFTIEVAAYNNAAGAVVPGSITVDGVVTDVFDAAALGEGFHTVMATFDAGSATNTLTINGVLQPGSGTMADAQADPGCKQKITKTVQIIGTPTNLVCNDTVYVSLDASCMFMITPDDVLEGSYGCYDDYTVELDVTLPLGNGPWIPAKVDADDIGHYYHYHLVHAFSGNVCSGVVLIEDKLPPVLTCPEDVTVACSESTDVSHTGNVTATDCDTYTVTRDDDYTNFGPCADPRAQIVRTFIVTDHSGNQSTCSQTITIVPFDLDDVDMPADITINCESAYLNASATSPENTGRPSINGYPLGVGGLCASSMGYTDVRLEICPGSYEILRTWVVASTCVPLGNGNPITHTQRIQVLDLGGPVFACPGDVTVSVDGGSNCCATAPLPRMIITEGCSGIVNLKAKVTGNDPVTGNLITFTVNGTLSDFPGNNYWVADTMAVFGTTQCLPRGVYQVEYTAEDHCGNLSSCSFNLTVEDLVPPVATCTQFTTVAIGVDDPTDCYAPTDDCQSGGVTWVPASAFNQGSYDDCNNVRFTVRRMPEADSTYSACIDGLQGLCDGYEYELATAENDSIKFYCCEVGTTQTVILRVYQVDLYGNIMYDADGNPIYNECMINVEVQDKIAPTCVPPASVTVSCENFDPSLWAYGYPEAIDNCCLDNTPPTSADAQGQAGIPSGTSAVPGVCGATQKVYYSGFLNANFDTTCNRGIIIRRFTAWDCQGQSSSCTQRITVTNTQDYNIVFPADVSVNCSSEPNIGKPVITNDEGCELIGIAYDDVVFTLVPDACYKIERTWTVLNWCTYNPDLPCFEVTRNPVNASGLAPSKNWHVFTDNIADDNCTTYKQIIKVLDQTPPTVVCAEIDTCDVSTNDLRYWNDGDNWWDNGTQQHDLCEKETEIAVTAEDFCDTLSIENGLRFRYLLFLDLDNDGIMETVVSSADITTRPVGRVLFNNYQSPNYGTGSNWIFDNNSNLNQRYRFDIEQTANGARVIWRNASGTKLPELAHGRHKIKWIAEDGCGNEAVCEKAFEIKDCKPPVVACDNVNINLMVGGMATLWANDFFLYGDDNCTPTSILNPTLAVIRADQNPDNTYPANQPQSVVVTCDDIAAGQPVAVQVWLMDAAGNADFCVAYVTPQANLVGCEQNPSQASVAGTLATEDLDGVEDANVEMAIVAPNGQQGVAVGTSNSNGVFVFADAVPVSGAYTLTPTKDDNPLNGVTTYDLVLISKHILGLEPLTSPYKLIAADANKSGSITTFDIVEFRKLILGIYNELPNNTSWRFVDRAYTFPEPSNPFTPQFPENISALNVQVDQLEEDFVGVKIGDVNGTVIANSLQSADERTSSTMLFDVQDRAVKAGETFTVNFKGTEKVQGYQFTMNLNGLEVMDITGTGEIKAGNFGVFQDALTTSVDGSDNEFAVTFRATKAGQLSSMLGVSSRITKAEAYSVSNNRMDVALRFNNGSTSTISKVGFELYQNQPNPFVNKTMIGFHLPEATEATLKVFDETGRLVFEQSGSFAKGYNTISVDRQLLNTVGVLYYTLETATDKATKKMIQSK